MQLKELLNIHGKINWGTVSQQFEVTHLCQDSREVGPGSVFIAIRGTSVDGHDYLSKAIEQGAQALVVENAAKVPKDYTGTVVEVLDGHLALQALAQNFYSQPGDQLRSLAVTGTNGKTSCTYIFEYLLKTLGLRCGVIGTIDHHFMDKSWSTNLTSPDPLTLQKRLQDFVNLGADSFVIEASSHALSQGRLQQGFDVCLFTNLSRDHLDYHGNMEHYLMSKAKLFSSEMLKSGVENFAILNRDDSFYSQLKNQVQGRVLLTYGQNADSDFCFRILESNVNGVRFELLSPDKSSRIVSSPLLGEHNIYNLVGVLASVFAMGGNLDVALSQWSQFPGIPGRMQLYRPPNKKDVYCFVDYAHTPDALEQVLKNLKKQLSEQQRLITVFGCGGDRDPGKRPLMGEIAAAYNDLVVVTSDNPRSEEPQKIINDILVGTKKSKAQIEPIVDRNEAIAYVAQQSKPGDVILIAGKGHEQTQTIQEKILPFDDYQKLVQHFHKDSSQ